jgi:16S rRNA (uracil1498-N3)-methyltransferase
LPRFDDPQPLAEVLPRSPQAVRFWATTRQQQLPHLAERLQSLEPGLEEIWLACGPEGGWSPDEEDQAQAQGWNPVQLGPTILRSATACVAGAAWFSGWRASSA